MSDMPEIDCQHHGRSRIFDHSVKPFKWRTLEGRHATLAGAKVALAEFVKDNPSVIPADLQAEASTD